MPTNRKTNIMKKITLLLLTIIAFSCGEHENVIYDPNTSTTFATFDATSTAMEVYLGDEPLSDTIDVSVSTLSSEDRTVVLAVDEELSTAAVESYNVDLQVTIPANEYFGTANITALTDELTLCSTATVVLNIVSVSDGGDFSAAAHSVGMTKNENPLPDDFAIGDYTLTFNGGGIGATANAGVWGDGTVVEVTAGSSNSERVFSVKCYPSFGFSNANADFSIDLVCGNSIFNGAINNTFTGVGCGSSIVLGPTSVNGSYNGTDDSNFTLVFAEDVGGASCGGEGITSYTFTKN